MGLGHAQGGKHVVVTVPPVPPAVGSLFKLYWYDEVVTTFMAVGAAPDLEESPTQTGDVRSGGILLDIEGDICTELSHLFQEADIQGNFSEEGGTVDLPARKKQQCAFWEAVFTQTAKAVVKHDPGVDPVLTAVLDPGLQETAGH